MAERPEVFNAGGTDFTVYPIYLAVDVSESMGWVPKEGGPPPIDTLNDEYRNLISELKSSPKVRQTAQMCIVSFAETAAVAVPLGELDDGLEFFAGGRTRYTKAFQLLRTQISADMGALARQGRSHYRPTVFFLTDGKPDPMEEVAAWPDPHAELVASDFPFHPHIFAVGFGDADEAVLARIKAGSGTALIARPGQTQSERLVEILAQIKHSVFNPGDGVLVVEPTAGLRQIKLGRDVPG